MLTNIPSYIDALIRARAEAEHKSPEQAIVDVLVTQLGSVETQNMDHQSQRPLSGWSDDPKLQIALREQRLIDWEAWDDGIKRRDLSDVAGLGLITPEMKTVFAEHRRVEPELWK